MEVVEVNGYEIGPGANLSGADLSDADLGDERVAGPDLSGAFADDDTIWPKGFNPTVTGVIFED